MRHSLQIVVLLGFCVVGAWFFSDLASDPGLRPLSVAAAADKPAEKPKAPPPLKVDRGAPLLLDAPDEKQGSGDKKTSEKGKGKKADNGACYVCHSNYQEEPMVQWHAAVDVGCVKCHGESVAHRNDENNITPPDIMYPTTAIDSACAKCHETHDVAARKVLARFAERCPNKKVTDSVVCTDCHGEHRLKLRTVRWDKSTRQLISASGTKSKALSGEKK